MRAQQNELSRPQRRDGERRLDAIDAQAAHDPVAARQMLEIYRRDQALQGRSGPESAGGR